MARRFLVVLVVSIGVVLVTSCAGNDPQATGGDSRPVRIVFLHHSTGQVVWLGRTPKALSKVLGKGDVQKWMSAYNKANTTRYEIEDMEFPTGKGYEWANYPYDYYNIWVQHAGDAPYRGQPTLEMLTKSYDVIIWKHCYPVGSIAPDTGKPDAASSEKRLENYKLQYAKLKDKMHAFPNKTFIVWTGAALTKKATTPEEAERERQFVDWVRSQWDQPGDNIFLWDFYQLETEGGPYLKEGYATSPTDPHPTSDFGGQVAPLFGQRIVNVIEGRGDSTSLTGQ